MNRKSVKRIKKAIRRWMNTPWTNGTYLKLCGIGAIAATGIAAASYVTTAVTERDTYKLYAELGYKKKEVPKTEEVWVSKYEIEEEDEEA